MLYTFTVFNNSRYIIEHHIYIFLKRVRFYRVISIGDTLITTHESCGQLVGLSGMLSLRVVV